MKMHGLGNDFVVIDARATPVTLTEDLVTRIADRHTGVGFDQLAVIRIVASETHLTFYNSDGSQSAACGNATRCIGQWLMDQTGQTELTLLTAFGALPVLRRADGLTSVNMGRPVLQWQAIPLAKKVDVDALPLEGAPLATSMGNPHCTFFVEDADAIDIDALGPRIEHDPLFPERTNVQVASTMGDDAFRVRVWERGVGRTLASGSSCCAVTSAAQRRGLLRGTAAVLHLDLGTLVCDMQPDGIWMTGPTAMPFTGVLTPEFLAP